MSEGLRMNEARVSTVFDAHDLEARAEVGASRPWEGDPAGEFTTLVAMLLARADSMGDATALGFINDDAVDTLTYRDLATRASRVAALLRRQGCAAGDRVMLLVPPGLEYVEAFFGCLLADAVPVPSYPPRGGRTLEKAGRVLQDSGASFVLLPRVLDKDSLRASLPGRAALLHLEDAVHAPDALVDPDPDPGSPAFLQYTSGSTSHPKGVVLSHRAVLANLAQIKTAFGHTAFSRGVNWLPPFHDMGLIGTILQPIYAGFPTYLMSPLAFVQRPSRWLKAISRFGATTVGAPNFAFELCVSRVRESDLPAIDLSSVRVLFCGAEPVRKDTLDRFVARFAPYGLDPGALFPCYGLAESTLFVTGVERGAGLRSRRATGGTREFVSCGRPRQGTTIRIVDPESLVVLPEGHIGEVWVSGSSLASGYWGQREISEAAFGATLAGEPETRFLRTGDLAFLAHGELYPTGRLKDIIIVAGRKLACEDIEHAALTSVQAGADRAAVAYAVSAEDGTEAIALAVELVDVEGGNLPAVRDAWARAIRDALSGELDVALAELHLVRRGDLLRTTSGKVERRASREALLDGSIAAAVSFKTGR